MRDFLNEVYDLWVYPRVSRLAGSLRTISRTMRGKSANRTLIGTLPTIAWSEAICSHPIRIVERRREHGNVRPNELAILAKAAAGVRAGDEIIEIGTFDGRTALNLAVNSAAESRVFTLDLAANSETKFALMKSERRFTEKPASGARFRYRASEGADAAAKITQYIGDSAQFDWSKHLGRAGLVFVDGSHAYEYVLHDSDEAFRLVAEGGIILWHDYDVFNGVTRALDELDSARQLGLRRIRDTSLVCWRQHAWLTDGRSVRKKGQL